VKEENVFKAKGSFWARVRSTAFALPALLAPHKWARVFFHRLRGVDIGRNVEIGYWCLIGGVHPSRVHLEDNVVITANTVILDHDNAYYYTFGGDPVCADVHIKEGSFIGIGSVIYPGVTIGPRAIVGALSFVKSDVPPYSVAVGQPARVVKRVHPVVDSARRPTDRRHVIVGLGKKAGGAPTGIPAGHSGHKPARRVGALDL
jgi:carbonic anhydrase/acetyltransferase-like protein (isoleucine patch superfamily)